MAQVLQLIFYGNPDGYPPIINGIHLLCEHGYRINLVCVDNGLPARIRYPSSAKITRCTAKGRGSGVHYADFFRQVWSHADPMASLVIGHDMHGLFPARALSLRFGTPLIYQIHEFNDGTQFGGRGSRLIHWLERRLSHTAALVIASDEQRADLIQGYHGLRNRPLVAANAPLRASTKELENRLAPLLESLGHRFDKIVLRQGMLGPSHALEATVSSIPMWENKAWGFVAIGPMTAEYRDLLLELAVSKGISDQFVILPPVPYDDLFHYTIGADVGHSFYEPTTSNTRFSTTSSNKLMEYVALGLPVLVSDREGPRKFVEAHQCGLSADESDPAAIADVVNILCRDSDLADSMGRNGAKAFQEIYSYEQQFARVIAAIDHLTGGPHETVTHMRHRPVETEVHSD